MVDKPTRGQHDWDMPLNQALDFLEADATAKAEAARIAAQSGLTAEIEASRDRTTHTGMQGSSTISDLREAVEDIVGALVRAGSGVNIAYSDVGSTLTISATGGGTASTDPEVVRDTVAAALRAGAGISIGVDDTGDTITISGTTGAAGTNDALGTLSNPITDATMTVAARDALLLTRAVWDTPVGTDPAAARDLDYNLRTQSA